MALLSPRVDSAPIDTVMALGSSGQGVSSSGLDSGEQAFWRAWLVATQALTDRLDGELNDAFGITLSDYECLAHLAAAPGRRVRMAELADLAMVSRSRLTYRINRLEEAALVRREPCQSDKRGYYAVLTDHGAEVLERAAPLHVAGVRARLIDQVPEDMADTLLAVLDRIAAASR